ncbi:MAG: glucosidase [Microcoleus sp. PH2017_29_MFU_D_A]|uniref:MGH1-like glycoside hydrolase domain-containing protein n=1 Tax=unclassified Microcoleus TaxID=2642155 RepID=UPI001D6BE2B1|nr:MULTISPECIES: glucosidase [unclassified Microcoleus]MCC3513415.1 glucosidase [Microcoleus sp. PH2017_17_BER_D_A]MCC3439756.1 glucosidase [Microcoleus sp. PH2017_05_CCC_O_A]MCC3451771.1 glucosidase [Microcoleus sp. PH2017_09_SFU_O_A]MCC3501089.1 glucosidase [Microcoleus sp. PH2017_15_JOR_U_A]MCC3538480.1 glucosidase [Microcoleus sp. PH2017_25_DOB_D_A]
MIPEKLRLQQDQDRIAYWKRWGPYVSERQWGTVREDYSPDGSAWDYFPHDQARSRVYRWGEDGIAGISDTRQRLCFAIALWNGHDPILKERIFGLTGNEGNHGEDVKEYYFYLDSTPTHSYMKCLYKYPQQAFPYAQLVAENQRRGKLEPEFELLDTGIFDGDRYFDVFVEYAKATAEDILIQITIANRGSEASTLQLLPTLWFRNLWDWNPDITPPLIKVVHSDPTFSQLEAQHPTLATHWLYCEGDAELLFTNNETNYQRLFGTANRSPYVKDGINNYVVNGDAQAINPDRVGTKFAARYSLTLAPGATKTVRLRLSDRSQLSAPFSAEFEQIFQTRKQEADQFYQEVSPFPQSDDERNIQRQAFAGLLWSKQYYQYSVNDWLKGDPGQPAPPTDRKAGRNHEWGTLFSEDILSMPDKWEYPWFAAWDLGFHLIPLAMIDPAFAKLQLDRLTREWYMHPNGQLPAYEWKFSDVNPPVQAWAALQVYQIEQKSTGKGDRAFLQRVFHKLLLNFTWWVNRKDMAGNNVFQGGFLGLDNIGIFDRSAELPTGGYLNQADGTSWMGMYCLNMLAIALELAKADDSYEDIASKFFEHFLYIADAIDGIGESNIALWDEVDGFYYDALHLPDGQQLPLKVRSLVGLIPLYAVIVLELETLEKFPGFKRRMQWFIRNRPDLKENVACMETPGMGARRLLAIAYRSKLQRILQRMLDEAEFFSPFGIRAISKYHQDHPYCLQLGGNDYFVRYEPAESSTGLFGGNSNWRGPVWFPVNYLIIEALERFHSYLGDSFKVECPTGSGQEMTLGEVAIALSHRLVALFEREASGRRPVYGGIEKFQTDPHWRDYILFHEYFHGDNGAGIGASHQTGWTGLVAALIHQNAAHRAQEGQHDHP